MAQRSSMTPSDRPGTVATPLQGYLGLIPKIHLGRRTDVPSVGMLAARASAADGAHAALDAADPGDTCQSPDCANGVLQTGRLGFCDLAHFFVLREQLRDAADSATPVPSW